MCITLGVPTQNSAPIYAICISLNHSILLLHRKFIVSVLFQFNMTIAPWGSTLTGLRLASFPPVKPTMLMVTILKAQPATASDPAKVLAHLARLSSNHSQAGLIEK